MIRGGAKGQQGRQAGRQKRQVKEHEGVGNPGKALASLGIVKILISGKPMESSQTTEHP